MTKRILIIIGGILIIVALVTVWVYVMFVGSPRDLPGIPDDFTLFDFGSTAEPTGVVTESTPGEERPTVPVTQTEPLQQLTTRPVIGYREVIEGTGTSTGTRALYYAEAGTGHVYRIDLATGEETRRSGTTIPEAFGATFSQNGRFVMIQAGYGGITSSQVLSMASSSENAAITRIKEELTNVAVVGETVLYTTPASTLIGKSFNLNNKTSQTLFTLPFREAVVLWGATTAETPVVFPKPSHLLPGYVYEVKGGLLTRLPISGYGVSAVAAGPLIGFGRTTSDAYQFAVHNRTTKITAPTAITALPEKCTGTGTPAQQTLWCAEVSGYEWGYPDTWHRGELAVSDTLYELGFTATTTSLTYLVNLRESSGRDVDVVKLSINDTGSALYFINRIDNSLWRYRLNP